MTTEKKSDESEKQKINVDDDRGDDELVKLTRAGWVAGYCLNSLS